MKSVFSCIVCASTLETVFTMGVASWGSDDTPSALSVHSLNDSGFGDSGSLQSVIPSTDSPPGRSTTVAFPSAVPATPFESALPLTELVVLGACLVFGLLANSYFVVLLRKSSLARKSCGTQAENLVLVDLASTRLYLETSLVLDTVILVTRAFSVFPFHSPFFNAAPLFHLILAMASFSILDVACLASAWITVALGLDQASSCAGLNGFPAGTRAAPVIVAGILALSGLLSLPSFVLFQHHLLTSPGGDMMLDFVHENLVEARYQVWSKLSLRFWLPLLLIAFSAAFCVISLKSLATNAADRAVADDSELHALKGGLDSKDSNRSALVVRPSFHDSSKRILFTKTCVKKLLIYLLVVSVIFVLTTSLYLKVGHLDVFDVFKSTARDLIEGGISDPSLAQNIVCLTSILSSLNCISSFLIFVTDHSLTRFLLKRSLLCCYNANKI